MITPDDVVYIEQLIADTGSDLEKLLKTGDGVLWLTDRKGRRVGVPVVKVAYVEVGAPAGDRRVGFGAP